MGQPRGGYRGGHRTEYASIHVLASSSVLKERTYCCTPRGSVIRTHQLESSSWIGSNLGKGSPISLICGLRANRASGGNYLRGGNGLRSCAFDAPRNSQSLMDKR